MKLITKELIQRFNEVGDQSEIEDPIVVAKFFDPVGSATWYATQYNDTTKIAYGYVSGLAYDEWGTFSFVELASIKRPLGLGIERDLYFKEQPISACITKNRTQELEGVPTKQEQDLGR